MQTLIVVPARYGSTRFPGKPLAKISGRAMVEWVADVAKSAAEKLGEDATYVVATDDERIERHCEHAGINVVMTSADLATGTDRALEAARLAERQPDIIVNLQGDAPFTPPGIVASLAQEIAAADFDVATPVVRLSWHELDELRKHKTATPFSGTTCIRGEDGKAIWFSKNIVPAIRNEETLRSRSEMSPILRHIGLYAFRRQSLERFASLPSSRYEDLEGLEQLRLLENGMSIKAVIVDRPELSISGVDTQADLEALESLIESRDRAV